MVSFREPPAESDVLVLWPTAGPSLAAVRALKLTVPELTDTTVTALFRRARGVNPFRVGRYPTLRAMELRRLLEEAGLEARLE